MRTIEVSEVTKLVRQLCIDANYYLPADLRQAFVALNPGWRAESVGLRVSNGGWLREMQLCYGKDFRPARCEARMFGPKNDAPLKIWRGL